MVILKWKSYANAETNKQKYIPAKCKMLHLNSTIMLCSMPKAHYQDLTCSSQARHHEPLGAHIDLSNWETSQEFYAKHVSMDLYSNNEHYNRGGYNIQNISKSHKGAWKIEKYVQDHSFHVILFQKIWKYEHVSVCSFFVIIFLITWLRVYHCML